MFISNYILERLFHPFTNYRPPIRLTAENTVALILRSGSENTSASRVRVEPLNDASLLVIIRVQADMAVPVSLGDNDGSLLRGEISLARLAGGQRAADGSARSTCC